jgi:protein O-GlcNAc transferase
MADRHRSGLAVEHIDVPDQGPVEPRVHPARRAGRVSALQTAYSACPLCDGTSVTLGFANCSGHALWHEPMPPTLEWMRCPACQHVHNRSYWTDIGLAEVLRHTAADPLPLSSASLQERRAMWTPVLDKVVSLLGGYRAIMSQASRPTWVDVGCGDGTLVMTAADCGIAAVGLETRPGVAARLQGLGCNALAHDFTTLKFEVVVDVLSMMDVLEQMPQPREALRKAAQVLRPGGVLVISTADMTSSSWRVMEAEQANPYWADLQRYHNFGRDRLVALLNDSGFEIADFRLPERARGQIELYAVRKAR